MENVFDNSTAEALLKRGRMALDDYNFREARRCFDQVLNMEPESGDAYIGLAMASARIKDKQEFLWYCVYQHGKDNRNLRRAREFANGAWAEFFEDVDKEIAQKEQEKAELAKTLKKTALIVAVIGLFVVALFFTLPLVIYAPAEQLYQDGQYKQAYKEAASISQSGFGRMFDDKVCKYAYAYLSDYLHEDNILQTSTAEGETIRVSAVAFSTGDTVIYCSFFRTTDEYRFHWTASIDENHDNVSCMFEEDGYTSSSMRSVYIQHGNFEKGSYTSGQSIEYTTRSGNPRYSDRSALRNVGEQTMAEALALIEQKLGIKAKDLGFDSYRP